MEATPENIYSPKGQNLRAGAKALTAKKMQLAIDGRLGLVIDGTGKDFNKIKNQADWLKKLGYETAIIFVNTDLDAATGDGRRFAVRGQLFNRLRNPAHHDPHDGLAQNIYRGTFVFSRN